MLLLRIILALAFSLEPHYEGYSSFALLHPRFPCSDFIRVVSSHKKPVVSVLWGTFGRSRNCLGRTLGLIKNRPHMLEIHFSNEPCRFNKRCHQGEFLPRYSIAKLNRLLIHHSPLVTRQIRKRVRAILNFILPVINENTRPVLSVGLEDRYWTKSFDYLHSIIKEEWPYETSRNPVVRTNHIGDADFIERHGLHVSCDSRTIVNNDGSNLPIGQRSDFYKRHANCRAVLFWRQESQGIFGKNFIPPRDRIFKILSNVNF